VREDGAPLARLVVEMKRRLIIALVFSGLLVLAAAGVIVRELER
jgi:hypothetical protein